MTSSHKVSKARTVRILTRGLRIFGAMSTVAVLLASAGCSAGEEEAPEGVGDGEELLEKAQRALESFPSLAWRIETSREEQLTIEYMRDGQAYRIQSDGPAPSPVTCTPIPGGLMCVPDGSVRTYYEEIWTTARDFFYRECDSNYTVCNAWQGGPGDSWLPYVSTDRWVNYPQSGMAIVRAARDMQIASEPQEGAAEIQLSGLVNPRAAERLVTPPTPTRGPSDLPFDHEEFEFYEDNPVRIDLWISSLDFRPLRLRLTGEGLPLENKLPDTVTTTLDLEFSRFGEVEFAVPTPGPPPSEPFDPFAE
jgi:hypothetical protein